MNEWIILYILTAHFVADFVLQTTWIGLNKSKDSTVLALHCLIYTFALCVLMFPLLKGDAAQYAVLNGAILHLPTDFISSKLSSKYHSEGRLYAFWKVIGLDQLAHYAGLFLTLPYFLPQ